MKNFQLVNGIGWGKWRQKITDQFFFCGKCCPVNSQQKATAKTLGKRQLANVIYSFIFYKSIQSIIFCAYQIYIQIYRWLNQISHLRKVSVYLKYFLGNIFLSLPFIFIASNAQLRFATLRWFLSVPIVQLQNHVLFIQHLELIVVIVRCKTWKFTFLFGERLVSPWIFLLQCFALNLITEVLAGMLHCVSKDLRLNSSSLKTCQGNCSRFDTEIQMLPLVDSGKRYQLVCESRYWVCSDRPRTYFLIRKAFPSVPEYCHIWKAIFHSDISESTVSNWSCV